MDPARRRDPLTYYGRESGIGMVLDGLKSMPDAKVGIIGMGTATVACYAERGQTYRFYEINPIAVSMARKWFTFIDDMQARGAKYELVLGDARLSLEHEEAHHFDVLMLDAFSGDSVPVHLLTREAFEIYQRHLKPDGVIAVHITNRYLNLAPVVERVAREFGYLTTRQCIPNDLAGHYQPDYLLLSKDAAFIRAHPPVPPVYARDLEVPLWTDHAHNLFRILRSR
jgi:SAM-dependent methyltransferase